MTPDDSPLRILLVEDDAKLASLLQEYLQNQGAEVITASDGLRGLDLGLHERLDVILLDLMLPGLDGIQVCKRLRERVATPIIMLTARGEEADRVVGLEIGADDYLPKPFSPRELLARIRAHVRRARGLTGPKAERLSMGDLVLDEATYGVTVEGRPVELTTFEFSILRALVRAGGRVLSREQLLELAGASPDDVFDRAIDVHISRIRQKLGDSARGSRIRTVRGAGYQLVAKPESPP